MTRPSGLALAACAAVAWWYAAGAAGAATRYDPALRFRSHRTAHFTIHYHQGEDRLALHLAVVAERVRGELESRLGLRAPAHTHVVIVDQADVANGWSTPVPYNLIEIAARAPAPASFLGQHNDWLTYVFTHEYAHVMHLDQVGGVMRGVRLILGRHPASFPNLFVPSWHVEGLATFAEHTGTGIGRTRAADVRAVAYAQAAAGRMPRLDQLGGGLVDWPWGYGPYFYGGLLFDHAVRESDSGAVGDLARRTARRFPFFGGSAFRSVFGKSASDLWREAAGTVSAAAAARAASPGDTPSRQLTEGGYLASAPRFIPQAAGGASDRRAVAYSRIDPRGFPALLRADAAGGPATKIVDRYLGSTMGFADGWIVYDQIEFNGPVAQHLDLYAHHVGRGVTVRLSRGSRLSDPDVSPDATVVAAVSPDAGEAAIVIRRIERAADGTPRLASGSGRRFAQAGCQFSTPRWSPDGRALAAGRHCAGSLPGVVTIDVESGRVEAIAPAPGARDITPAWLPGGTTLLFASDREGDEFRIYAIDISPRSWAPAGEPRLLIRASGGAHSPDVSPSGGEIVFLSATAFGIEVFIAPLPAVDGRVSAGAGALPSDRTSDGPPGDLRGQNRVEAGNPPGRETLASTPYSPWHSLLPRAWAPIVEADDDRLDVGGAIEGADVLARHLYAFRATWPARRPAVTPGFSASGRLDWQASYVYDRWRPSFFVVASADTETLSLRSIDPAVTYRVRSRTREAVAGVLLPVRRVRWSQAWLLAAALVDRRTALPARELQRTRNALRAGWTVSTAREYGDSISPEHGVRAGMTFERVSPSLGADGASDTATLDVRAYAPGGFPNAVIAVRAGAGASRGDAFATRVFTNSGSARPGSLLSFDADALALLRGFDRQALAGTAIASLNVDYRVPLVRVERGAGTWPLLINRVHAAVFADVVAAGDRFSTLTTPSWSAGAECAATITVGYGLRMTVAAGAAWTRGGAGAPDPGRVAFFARTGYAF